ncbi:adenylate cyclase type 2 [Parasteatoda tepidariorum]|uniref:adenylate cyclase type 2 n=1 Tax=Parasteatoda tepidariorum TaxID=114398 RepID=UPI001C72718E|nr:adenylate cyclase type 2 [Parasteatoda tepidariorum]
MSGLELVARDSKSEIENNAEAAKIYFHEVYCRDDDERNWSFSYLREQLLLKNSQELFRKYQMRIQHALFVELLVFNLAYNALSFSAFLFLPQLDSLSEVSIGAVKTGRWCRSLNFFLNLVIFIAAYCKENLFKSPYTKITVAGVVLGSMVTGEMATTIYRITKGELEPTMRQTYYVVLTTCVLLPFPRKTYSAISGASVIVIDITLSIFSSLNSNKLVVLLADLAFMTTTLFVGLFIRYIIEIMNRRAFLDRRECLESKIKIETAKNQEELFLQSILPVHIAREVREDLRNIIKNANQIRIVHKPFNKLYVEKHKGVSILYADIVNSMLLTASLKASDLVATLNDLFGRFDKLTEKNNCMRIKFLGDCYYLVSGFPEKTSKHADNCVLTGLEMIETIRRVRERRNVNVDMRIGVHSGNILGGLLGLRKWQFDIWSKDVTIASHMEQGGVPGQVHITRSTKEQLIDTDYDIVPGEGYLRDSYLQEEEIETFLIRPSRPLKIAFDSLDSSESEMNKESNNARFQRQISRGISKISLNAATKRQSSNESLLPLHRRGASTVTTDNSLNQFRKMVRHVNKIMENTIYKMALSKKDQWSSSVGIHPLLLFFREFGKEKPYLEQPDPLFKHYLLCVVVIFLGLTTIHLLIMSSTLEFWLTYGAALVLIISACVPAWYGYIWIYLKQDENDQLLNSSALKVSRTVWKSTVLRMTIWFVVSSVVLFCSLQGLSDCFFNPAHRGNSSSTPVKFSSDLGCEYPWFYTLCAALAMTTTSVFLRIHFLLKLILNGVALSIIWYRMDEGKEDIFEQASAKLSDWEEFGFPADRSHCYYLTFVLLILHILDRQIEYVCRLDFLEKVKLRAEQEEVKTMEMLNRILLFNILPPHVARFYLTMQLESHGQRVEVGSFHEERCAVAVLFASIPSFADFYYEDKQNEEGLRCIQLLNEIICDFDKLLRQREFQAVEKIKTIGSTYMAACGLQTQEKGSLVSEENPTGNVATLSKFAAAMMHALHELNKDAMQDFQLRAGISVGPVMAGVVGTVKPQYDIWGDTVNVASRMDSTGIPGRIQVTKEVADLLSSADNPYQMECRGEIFVKGKGKLTTYLLKTSYDEPGFETTEL